MNPARIVLKRRIMSLSGRGMRLVMLRAIGPLGLGFQKPFWRSRVARVLRGTASQRFPVARRFGPLIMTIRLMRVPRNLTLPYCVLVIRVFSSDRVKPRV